MYYFKVFFFNSEKDIDNIFSQMSNAVSYIFQHDKLIFLFHIFTKLMNTSVSVGKLDFNLISLIAGACSINLIKPANCMRHCGQAMSYFHLDMDTFL